MTATQTCPLQISLSHTNIHSIFSLLILIYQPEICSHITTLLLTEISNILFAHPTNIHGMFKMRQPPYQVLPVMPTFKSSVKVIPRVIRTSSFFSTLWCDRRHIRGSDLSFSWIPTFTFQGRCVIIKIQPPIPLP